MKVTIMYRNSWYVKGGWIAHPLTVEISDNCPACGGPRGIPYWHRFYETGDWHSVNRWDNPCGHIDKYKAAFEEAKDLQATQDDASGRI